MDKTMFIDENIIRCVIEEYFNRYVDNVTPYYQFLPLDTKSQLPSVWQIRRHLPHLYIATIDRESKDSGFVIAEISESMNPRPFSNDYWDRMHKLILDNYFIKITPEGVICRINTNTKTRNMGFDESWIDMLLDIYKALVMAHIKLEKEHVYQESVQKQEDEEHD